VGRGRRRQGAGSGAGKAQAGRQCCPLPRCPFYQLCPARRCGGFAFLGPSRLPTFPKSLRSGPIVCPGGVRAAAALFGLLRTAGAVIKSSSRSVSRGSRIVPAARAPRAMGHPGQCRGDTVLPPATPSGRAESPQHRQRSPPPGLQPTRGLGCFWGPRADISPCPGAAWKRMSSAQRYFKSRGLAAAPGPNCLALRGAVGGPEPNT